MRTDHSNRRTLRRRRWPLVVGLAAGLMMFLSATIRDQPPEGAPREGYLPFLAGSRFTLTLPIAAA